MSAFTRLLGVVFSLTDEPEPRRAVPSALQAGRPWQAPHMWRQQQAGPVGGVHQGAGWRWEWGSMGRWHMLGGGRWEQGFLGWGL